MNKNTVDRADTTIKKRVAGGGTIVQQVPTPVSRKARTAKSAR